VSSGDCKRVGGVGGVCGVVVTKINQMGRGAVETSGEKKYSEVVWGEGFPVAAKKPKKKLVVVVKGGVGALAPKVQRTSHGPGYRVQKLKTSSQVVAGWGNAGG